MHKLIKSLSLVLIGLLLVSCATQAKYQQMLNGWQGRNIEDFINVWGYPDQTITALNGDQVYVYHSQNVVSFPSMTTPGYTTVSSSNGQTIVTQAPSISSGGGTFYYDCTTWVEFNKQHIITKTLFRGNNCVST
ncbi:MAG: hypothetical protein K0S29_987 [Gammaproteobacteria bacterium]|nr:hypothetical protein [Gammaproteobacteria bacterium]